MAYKKIRVQEAFRTSLEAQWLRLHTHNAGSRGSIPDWERLRMLHHQKKKRRRSIKEMLGEASIKENPSFSKDIREDSPE